MAAATQSNFYSREMWHPQGVEYSELARPVSNSECPLSETPRTRSVLDLGAWQQILRLSSFLSWLGSRPFAVFDIY